MKTVNVFTVFFCVFFTKNGQNQKNCMYIVYINTLYSVYSDSNSKQQKREFETNPILSNQV